MSWEVLNCDNMDPERGLPSLADKSVDHVICDPPYMEHTHTKQRSGGPNSGGKKTFAEADYCHDRDLGFEHLSIEAMAHVAAEMVRVSRRWVVVFSDDDGAYWWKQHLVAAGSIWKRTAVWIKRGAAPQFTGDRPGQGHEYIVCAHVGKSRWNGGGKLGIYDATIARGDRLHTTQKPLDMMEAIVRDFTDPGDLILDPYAGSGTTLLAAKRLGRSALGMEMNAEYARIAQRRIEYAREQRELFA